MSDPFAEFKEIYQYRASELGSCVKRLVAGRMGMPGVSAVSPKMQATFDRGNDLEIACKAVMLAKGWTLHSEQDEVVMSVGDIPITGHMDGMGKPPGILEAIPDMVLEVKSPYSYHKFMEECYLTEVSPLTEHYRWQLSFYMIAKNAQGVMITLDDNTLHSRVFEEPFYTWDDICNRIADIEALANAESLPKFCSIRDYPCPYFLLHEDALEYVVDSEFDAYVEQYAYWADIEGKAKAEKKKLVEGIKENLGESKEKLTEFGKVSLYDRTTVKYDYAKMRADGIDVDKYKTESVTKDIPKVTWKGE